MSNAAAAFTSPTHNVLKAYIAVSFLMESACHLLVWVKPVTEVTIFPVLKGLSVTVMGSALHQEV